MKQSPLSRTALGAVLLLMCAATASAGGGTPQLDNQKGRWMHFEIGHLDPIAFGSNPDRFFTFNQPGARVFRIGLAGFSKGPEIPTGPGLVSLALRPGTTEIWALDRVTSTISVIESGSGRLERTIHVGAEPHGLVFTANGDRAYVTCSAVDRVDVVDAASYSVVGSVAIPANSPRGIVLVGDWVYVVPFFSGNGTAPLGNAQSGSTQDIVGVRDTKDYPGVNPLPDRDLFAFQVSATPGAEVLDPSRTVSELGTILFNVRHRPGTNEIWIPHTDALNGEFVGEKAFIDGQVVRNRVTIVDTSLLGNGNNQSAVTIVDLDQLAPRDHLRPSAPTDVAFTSDGARAFICGYGADKVAVLGIAGSQVSWSGSLLIKTSDRYPNGVGPRCLKVSPDDKWLVIYNKGENSIQRVALNLLPASGPFEHVVTEWLDLGFDPTPGDLIQGRVHFIRTQNSGGTTSSCNSCHPDGHLDGLAWDLGVFLDPEGTDQDAMAFPLDNKGPMVTQSVRHTREIGPFHWRGEIKRLRDFNPTFINLLERKEHGIPLHLGPDFLYVVQYMEHLAIPPNPRQARDRRLTAEQQEGFLLFRDEPVLNGLACADCHSLPLGTSGEIVDNGGGGHAPTGVVPQLREIADKLTPPFLIGGDFGTRTEQGIGLGHGGAESSLASFLLRPLPPPQVGTHFDLTPAEAAKIESYLVAFDTGMGHAAAWQATANAQNVGTIVATDIAFLLDQAQAGSCDVIYRFGPEDWNGNPTYFSGVYDPASNQFIQASTTLPRLSLQNLLTMAGNGKPVTFIGVSPMMGWTMGIDRDDDKLLDLDEAMHGADWEEWDTDFDDFPDGYEVQWGLDPTVENSSSPDNEAPSVIGPVEIVYTTTNAVRLEWRTSEPTRVLVSYNGQTPVLRAPLKPRWDDGFSEIVAKLQPGTLYQFTFKMEDLNGNIDYHTFDVTTRSLALPEPARIESIELVQQDVSGSPVLRSRALLTLGLDGPAIGYDLHATAYYKSDDESVYEDLGDHVSTTGTQGFAIFFLPIPPGITTGAGKLYFSVERVDAPGTSPSHAEGMDVLSWEVIDY